MNHMRLNQGRGGIVPLLCIAMLLTAITAGCSAKTVSPIISPSPAVSPEPAALTPSPVPVRTASPGLVETPTPSPSPTWSPTPSPAATPAPTPTPAPQTGTFGVFIGLNPDETDRLAGYDTVVIDAMYFSAEEIAALHQAGHTVYTYLNVGSVEKFREYYNAFKRSTLGPYENWPDERWMDPSNPEWQAYVPGTLGSSLVQKGVDGFFLDNLDVYYLYHREEIYQGLVTILAGLDAYGLPLIVNGGETFVRELAANGQSGLIDGVNQEEVFTSINFDNGTYELQDAEDSAHCREYLALCKGLGLKVYLTEYAADPETIGKIAAYCAENGFSYYIAAGLELD